MDPTVTHDDPSPRAADTRAEHRSTQSSVSEADRTARTDHRWPRAIFWSDEHERARTPWLILLPLLGAFMAAVVSDMVTVGRLAGPLAQLVVSASSAVVAVVLVLFSRRFLGARRGLTDYGLAIDRHWLREACVGFGIGIIGVSIPFLVGIAAGWIDVAAVLDRGALPLWPGILLLTLAMLFTGLWEELVLRGVFVCNAADGLRRWLSPGRAVTGGVVLSAVVFGLGHVSQDIDHPALLLTWVLPGVVFGVIYVLTGSLAIPIGAHAAFNITGNLLFSRTDVAGLGELSAVMRVEVDPALAVLTYGGALEATAFVLVWLLALLWIRRTRGALTLDLDALRVEKPLPSER